jgi:hypothetical protein
MMPLLVDVRLASACQRWRSVQHWYDALHVAGATVCGRAESGAVSAI